MKEGWRYEKLDDLGTIVTGATPSTNDESNYFPKEYCFVKPSDLPLNGVGSIHETENYVSSKGLSVSRPLPAGSVLTTCIGTIGKVGLLLQEGCTNQQINAVIPNNKINSRYLAYALLSIRKQLEFIANAPVVPIINKKCFSKIHIGYPPKPTQLSIVSELDKLNELIQIKKEQLKDYDALAQSIFYEMFGDPVVNDKKWEVKQLKDVSTLLNGRAYKQQELLDKGKYKVLRVGNFFTNSTFYYSDLELDDDKYCEYGDLLFAWSASFGAFIWNGDKVIYHYHIWKVLFDKDCLDIQYYRYLLNTMTSFFMNDVHGIGMVHLTKSGMEQYVLPIPPLPLQQSFAHKIEQIERQKAAVQRTIKDLETLLAARMQYWFD